MVLGKFTEPLGVLALRLKGWLNVGSDRFQLVGAEIVHLPLFAEPLACDLVLSVSKNCPLTHSALEQKKLTTKCGCKRGKATKCRVPA